jgi:hypothetical protein
VFERNRSDGHPTRDEQGYGRASKIVLKGISVARLIWLPPSADDLSQLGLASQRAEGRANFLGQQRRHTDHRRGSVVEAPDRVQIVFEPILCHRLHNHPGAIRLEMNTLTEKT